MTFALLLALQAVDADGFRVHTLASPRQAGETVVRVLLPDQLEGRAPVVYVLPVEAGRESKYGDGLLEAKKLGLHNRHGVICVAPTFSRLPWYADHPTDPAIAQESYFLKDVLPLIEKTYPTSHRLLLGFSKSGHGAFSLLLRHPELFQRALAWDAPLMMDHHDRYGSGQVYGTAENFRKYRPADLLGNLDKELRLIHMGFDAFRDHHEGFEKLLKGPHIYRDGPKRAHRWDSGWLEPAFELLVDPPRK